MPKTATKATKAPKKASTNLSTAKTPDARNTASKANAKITSKPKTNSTQIVPKLAIVIPCYNEEAVITQTYKVLCEKLEQLIAKNSIRQDSFLCFVDDGSKDKTCEILLSLKGGAFTGASNTSANSNPANPHRLIKLSKNYGHQVALLAGLEFVSEQCDCVVSMDCDLQDDINAIDEMLAKFNAEADIVYGVRKARNKDTWFKKNTALGFYKLMHTMGVEILYNHADYRLLSARACRALLEFKEVNLFLRGIVPLIGYKSEVVYYERLARFAGVSKYPFRKMLSFALNGITNFSIIPLRMMSVLGGILFLLSIMYGLYALYMKFFTAEPISGWTSTILILLFFGGMQFLGLGIMGEYIGKIYAEVKRRPRYFVEEVL